LDRKKAGDVIGRRFPSKQSLRWQEYATVGRAGNESLTATLLLFLEEDAFRVWCEALVAFDDLKRWRLTQ
jgi:hypothetical protein